MKSKGTGKQLGLGRGPPSSYGPGAGVGEFYSDDYDVPAPPKQKQGSKGDKTNGKKLPQQSAAALLAAQQYASPLPLKGAGRTRPTNNQLLYKAYFRWSHYPWKLKNATSLPEETDSCASVTAAFLQVLHILNTAETLRMTGPKRNILQMLSTNTRRTKVVELSTGTHRVPEELKKHYLSDGEGGQYSTNLDRNRYGNDDNYLFTVIRYDLEFLQMCPCLIDVEIVDSKAGNQAIIVSCGHEACVCQGNKAAHPPVPAAAPARPREDSAYPANSAGTLRGSLANLASLARDSPRKTESAGASQLFDALVMAATGEQEGAAAAGGLGGEPPVTSPNRVADRGMAAAGTGAMFASGAARGTNNKSKLWSATSFGEYGDSLQNALDAFRAEEEIVSKPLPSDSTQGEAPPSLRQRRRKPVRNNTSSFLRPTDSEPKASLLNTEKSDDNLKFGEDISPGLAGAADSGDDDIPLQEEGLADNLPARIPVLHPRHVPRQSSAANLGARVANNEQIKRLAAEVEQLQNDNKALRQQLKQQQGGGSKELEQEKARTRQLESENNMLRTENTTLSSNHKVVEERCRNLTVELSQARQQINILLSKLMSIAPGGLPGFPGAPAPVPVAANGMKLADPSCVGPFLLHHAVPGALDPSAFAPHFAAHSAGVKPVSQPPVTSTTVAQLLAAGQAGTALTYPPTTSVAAAKASEFAASILVPSVPPGGQPASGVPVVSEAPLIAAAGQGHAGQTSGGSSSTAAPAIQGAGTKRSADTVVEADQGQPGEDAWQPAAKRQTTTEGDEPGFLSSSMKLMPADSGLTDLGKMLNSDVSLNALEAASKPLT